MIPEFPNFKSLELSDKEEIEDITSRYQPYSDFNFVSLWSWDVKAEIRISKLNRNLVIRFNDYLTGEQFYSFLGNNKINETVNSLLKLSKKGRLKVCLRLVPEVLIKNIDKKIFKIEEDRDSFDYVYLIEKLKTYDGNKLRGRRNFYNRFKKKYLSIVKIIKIPDVKFKHEALNLLQLWAKNKGLTPEEIKNEQKAIERCFLLEDNDEIIITGVYIEEKLVAFSICEILDAKFAVLHFEKADEKYEGIYSYLMQENAKILSKYSLEYLNFEQDLGLPGLRLSKKSFSPIFFLKKYRISYV